MHGATPPPRQASFTYGLQLSSIRQRLWPATPANSYVELVSEAEEVGEGYDPHPPRAPTRRANLPEPPPPLLSPSLAAGSLGPNPPHTLPTAPALTTSPFSAEPFLQLPQRAPPRRGQAYRQPPAILEQPEAEQAEAEQNDAATLPQMVHLQAAVAEVRRVVAQSLLPKLSSAEELVRGCTAATVADLSLFYAGDHAFSEPGAPGPFVAEMDAILLHFAAQWPPYRELADSFGWRATTPPQKVVVALVEHGRSMEQLASSRKTAAAATAPQQDLFDLLHGDLFALLDEEPPPYGDFLRPLLQQALVATGQATRNVVRRVRALYRSGSAALRPFSQSMPLPASLTAADAASLAQLFPLQRQIRRELQELTAHLRREIETVADLKITSLRRVQRFYDLQGSHSHQEVAAALPKSLPCPVFRHRQLAVTSVWDAERVLNLQGSVLDVLETAFKTVCYADRRVLDDTVALPKPWQIRQVPLAVA